MIGQLPRSLTVGGVSYPIETDYRNVLVFLAACQDPELSEHEKLEILVRRLYRKACHEITAKAMEEAVRQAQWFVDCGKQEESQKPPLKIIDWEQDEAIIFPAVNKIAGGETRSQPYIHWWTFMGYFMEIEEGTFSTVLAIRQKRAKGRKLEKWEQDFFRNNKGLCELKKRYTAEEQAEIDYWNELLR